MEHKDLFSENQSQIIFVRGNASQSFDTETKLHESGYIFASCEI